LHLHVWFQQHGPFYSVGPPRGRRPATNRRDCCTLASHSRLGHRRLDLCDGCGSWFFIRARPGPEYTRAHDPCSSGRG
jgi:hypothetical protein